MFCVLNLVVFVCVVRFGGGVVVLGIVVFIGLWGELVVVILFGFFGVGLMGWILLVNVGFGNFGGLFGGGVGFVLG